MNPNDAIPLETFEWLKPQAGSVITERINFDVVALVRRPVNKSVYENVGHAVSYAVARATYEIRIGTILKYVSK